MKQFILSEASDEGGFIRITGKDFHYLARVRRFRPGLVFTALIAGKSARIKVISITKNCLTGECLPMTAELSAQPVLPPLILFQALPKGVKMDLIIRQAAEGGAAEVVPFISARSVPKPRDWETRLERWRRIIREARQQSGSNIDTAVSAPAPLEAALQHWEELRSRHKRPAGVLLHHSPLEQGSFHRYLSGSPDLTVLAIGPEGGFSPEEISRCIAAGFKSLTMGSAILRVETAALYAQAAVRIILLERPLWMPTNR
ncbi:MAG: 16S rRNA (uracil(1498)-N(3))-methyltransferase [Treponema sp.]|jgi:16S rRNA (uracil1498-N3)-methyltransferase|nr:16S rRNA (uracil(1498)-N(3))-methyltransferase [Treponema sp.]